MFGKRNRSNRPSLGTNRALQDAYALTILIVRDHGNARPASERQLASLVTTFAQYDTEFSRLDLSELQRFFQLFLARPDLAAQVQERAPKTFGKCQEPMEKLHAENLQEIANVTWEMTSEGAFERACVILKLVQALPPEWQPKSKELDYVFEIFDRRAEDLAHVVQGDRSPYIDTLISAYKNMPGFYSRLRIIAEPCADALIIAAYEQEFPATPGLEPL